MKLYCGTNFLMIALTILPFSSNKLWQTYLIILKMASKVTRIFMILMYIFLLPPSQYIISYCLFQLFNLNNLVLSKVYVILKIYQSFLFITFNLTLSIVSQCAVMLYRINCTYTIFIQNKTDPVASNTSTDSESTNTSYEERAPHSTDSGGNEITAGNQPFRFPRQ